MDCFDVAVIGGGLLGCFAARNLTRYSLKTVLIEKESDVCCGISKANTAIVYAGYDNEPGSLKAELTVKANAGFENLCRELDVPFSRCGSLMLGLGTGSEDKLKQKLENGIRNGLCGLRIVDKQEAQSIEPGIDGDFFSALYCPSTGVVDPWKLCYAAYENAISNGCIIKLGTELTGISGADNGFILTTSNGEIFAKGIVNCAGLNADRVQEMMFDPSVRISVNSGDYLVVGQNANKLSHVIFCENKCSKGLTAVPTIEGNILFGTATRQPRENLNATEKNSLISVINDAVKIMPGLATDRPLHSFATARPNPQRVKPVNGGYVFEKGNIGSFVVEKPAPGFISFIGIKTPGLTCADELGKMASDYIAGYMEAERNADYNPVRKSIPAPKGMDLETRRKLIEHHQDYGEIVCLCNETSKGEIVEAIHRGAVSIDGVKRRTGAVLGACQGSRCRYAIAKILSEELKVPPCTFFDEGHGK